MNGIRIIVGTPVSPPPGTETLDFDTPAELLAECAMPEVIQARRSA